MKKFWLCLAILSILMEGRFLMAQSTESKVFYKSKDYTIYADRVERGKRVATLDAAAGTIVSNGTAKGLDDPQTWQAANDLSRFPVFECEFPIINAIWRLACDDYMKNLNENGVLSASAGRPPWVRDTAYVAWLSSSLVMPEETRSSLAWNIHPGGTVDPEQIFDVYFGITYTMSDFVVMIPAIWEYVKITGDVDFIKRHWDDLVRTIGLATREKYDWQTNLYNGGASFEDGPNAYPERTPGFVETKGASTNILHYASNVAMAEMGAVLGKPLAEREAFMRRAAVLRASIDEKLWLEPRGFYAQLLVDGEPRPQERSDGLGEALAILMGQTGEQRSQRLLRSTPDSQWGIPTIYPFYSNRPRFHDGSTWPFVEGHWSIANARMGNAPRLLHGLAAMTQMAALAQTFKELVALPEGESLGADYQLWSTSGYVGIILKGLAGLEPQLDGLLIRPTVPDVFAGGFELRGLKYRGATLNLKVNGAGNIVKSFALDGQPSVNVIPASLTGEHTVVITMTGQAPALEMDIPEFGVTGQTLELSMQPAVAEGQRLVMFARVGANGKLERTEPARIKDGRAIFEIATASEHNALPQAVEFFCALENAQGAPVQIDRLRRVTLRPAWEAVFEPGRMTSGRPLAPGLQIPLTIKLSNNAADDVTLRLDWATTQGLTLSGTDEKVKCPAGQSVLAHAMATVSAPLDYGRYPVRVSVDGKDGGRVEQVFTVAVEDSMDLRGLWHMLEVKGEPDLKMTDPELLDADFSWYFAQVPNFWEDMTIFTYRWELLTKFKDYDGQMWFRRHALVPQDWAGHDLELWINKIANEDTTWFNGVQIGSTKGRDIPRRYRIPAELVRVGEDNVIAILVTDTGGEGGLTSWPLQLSVLPKK